MLMLYHHLFAFPERLPSSYELSVTEIERVLAEFGKICIFIYLFLTGYGFAVRGRTDWLYYFYKIRFVMVCYWVVFISFILILYFYGTDFEFDSNFLFNFFALSFDYVSEWWFLEPYLIICLLFPVFLRMSDLYLSLISFVSFVLSFFLLKIDFVFFEIEFGLVLFLLPVSLLGLLVANNTKM